MKKLIIFSTLNGFVGAFLWILMSDYFVSERFAKIELSSEMFIGGIVLFAILSSIGFVVTARKQTVGRIWGAFGIEVASSMLFVITDLVLKTTGISINLFTVYPYDNPATGLLIIFFGLGFIALSLLIHIIAGVVFTILSTKNKSRNVSNT